MLLAAPRPDAATSAAGVARPSAHGQAMISTASPALNAGEAGDPARSQPARGAAAHARTTGTKTPLNRAAGRGSAALSASAASTNLISRDSWVSGPTLRARTTSPA